MRAAVLSLLPATVATSLLACSGASAGSLDAGGGADASELDGQGSTDAGATDEGGAGSGGASGWSVVASGTSEDLFGVDFADGMNGWAVGASQTILHTSDGGRAWSIPASGLYTATTPPSPSAGTHWITPHRADPTYNLRRVHAPSPMVAWISTYRPLKGPGTLSDLDTLTPVFVTKDGGASWTRVALATNFEVWGIHAFDADSAVAVTIGNGDPPPGGHADSDMRLIVAGADTAPLGRAWFAAFRDVFFLPDRKTGWAFGWSIYKTPDGGKSWKKMKDGFFVGFWAGQFVDERVGWAAGDGGDIERTDDGGAIWTKQASGTKSALYGLSFADASNGWVVGKGGLVLRTTDGGASWNAESSGTSEDLRDVKAVSATEAWAVGAKGALVARR